MIARFGVVGKKYRSIDILLIDDIQFIIDKKRAQEVFSIPLIPFMRLKNILSYPRGGKYIYGRKNQAYAS